MNTLAYIERSTDGADPGHTIIWLHGLGADGYDFFPIVPQLGLATAVRFIFPHAPTMPITINGGAVMRAWYDILSIQALNRALDLEGIERSIGQINHLI